MLLSYLLPLIGLNSVLGYPIDNPQDPFADLSSPYTPSGGVGTDNNTVPYYHPLSDFDYQSFLLGLNQEYIELDLFNFGLAKFTNEEFYEYGFTDSDLQLIHYMAQQEVGHAELISNILGESAPTRCNYTYPFQTVPEFIDFTQRVTRWGESGVFGFLGHLDSRAAATLLTQSISSESRQELTFRQFQGLAPQPYHFIAGIPQSWAFTLINPYITSCPAKNPKIEFANFPALKILNPAPSLQSDTHAPPAIATTNNTLTQPGRKVEFNWENKGLPVGWIQVDDAPVIDYNNAGDFNGSRTGTFNGSTLVSVDDGSDITGERIYRTDSLAKGPAKYAAWVSQLNVTYSELHDVDSEANTAWTLQPNATVFPGNNTIVNGTVFVALVDEAVPLTSFNLTQINNHVVAGPALYEA